MVKLHWQLSLVGYLVNYPWKLPYWIVWCVIPRKLLVKCYWLIPTNRFGELIRAKMLEVLLPCPYNSFGDFFRALPLKLALVNCLVPYSLAYCFGGSFRELSLKNALVHYLVNYPCGLLWISGLCWYGRGICFFAILLHHCFVMGTPSVLHSMLCRFFLIFAFRVLRSLFNLVGLSIARCVVESHRRCAFFLLSS